MKKMTIDEAIQALDNISRKDPESAHSDADDILLRMVNPLVKEAYERLEDECAWWDFA